MKKLIATILIAVCGMTIAMAQSDQQKGKGSVKVSQSAEIDALVSGKKGKPDKVSKKQPQDNKAASSVNIRMKMQEMAPPPPRPTVPDAKASQRPEVGVSKGPRMVTKIVHKRVKVLGPDGRPLTRKVTKRVAYKGIKKTAGFRVQVFSGGNTRVDRQKAEQAGRKVKAKYPDAPVYVHFYSPRWICRVGNFTDHKEAASMLHRVKELGFPGAVIVRTPVTVRNTQFLN